MIDSAPRGRRDPFRSWMRGAIFHTNTHENIMASTAGKKRVTFAVEAESRSEVAVAGTFNDWQPLPLACKGGDPTAKFTKMIYLPTGRYEYKFLIDGNWSIDPNCPSWSPNEYGSLNSVVEVR